MNEEAQETENMGDDTTRIPNEWYKQSQKDERWNIELAREQINKDREFGESYYGGRL